MPVRCKFEVVGVFSEVEISKESSIQLVPEIRHDDFAFDPCAVLELDLASSLSSQRSLSGLQFIKRIWLSCSSSMYRGNDKGIKY